MSTGTPEPTDWLADAVIYEIYPQSFADSDGDGIGDFPGVLARLDHLSGWVSTRSGSTRASPRPSSTPATTSPTTCRSPRATAPTTTWSRSSRRPGLAGSGCCWTWWLGTPRSSTPGSSRSSTPTGLRRTVTAISGRTGWATRARPWVHRGRGRGWSRQDPGCTQGRARVAHPVRPDIAVTVRRRPVGVELLLEPGVLDRGVPGHQVAQHPDTPRPGGLDERDQVVVGSVPGATDR